MIDGIKYEKLTIGQTEWSMQLFREDELKDYFEQCMAVNKSVFDRVIYDSEVERRFAEELDKRDDIKLFVKLPNWFRVETPIGEYNPDWAIVKHFDQTIYLVRETKSTKDFEKLRNSEADKVRCGRKHFEAIDVNFDVVTSAAEIIKLKLLYPIQFFVRSIPDEIVSFDGLVRKHIYQIRDKE